MNDPKNKNNPETADGDESAPKPERFYKLPSHLLQYGMSWVNRFKVLAPEQRPAPAKTLISESQAILIQQYTIHPNINDALRSKQPSVTLANGQTIDTQTASDSMRDAQEKLRKGGYGLRQGQMAFRGTNGQKIHELWSLNTGPAAQEGGQIIDAAWTSFSANLFTPQVFSYRIRDPKVTFAPRTLPGTFEHFISFSLVDISSLADRKVQYQAESLLEPKKPRNVLFRSYDPRHDNFQVLTEEDGMPKNAGRSGNWQIDKGAHPIRHYELLLGLFPKSNTEPLTPAQARNQELKHLPANMALALSVASPFRLIQELVSPKVLTKKRRSYDLRLPRSLRNKARNNALKIKAKKLSFSFAKASAKENTLKIDVGDSFQRALWILVQPAQQRIAYALQPYCRNLIPSSKVTDLLAEELNPIRRLHQTIYLRRIRRNIPSTVTKRLSKLKWLPVRSPVDKASMEILTKSSQAGILMTKMDAEILIEANLNYLRDSRTRQQFQEFVEHELNNISVVRNPSRNWIDVMTPPNFDIQETKPYKLLSLVDYFIEHELKTDDKNIKAQFETMREHLKRDILAIIRPASDERTQLNPHRIFDLLSRGINRVYLRDDVAMAVLENNARLIPDSDLRDQLTRHCNTALRTNRFNLSANKWEREQANLYRLLPVIEAFINQADSNREKKALRKKLRKMQTALEQDLLMLLYRHGSDHNLLSPEEILSPPTPNTIFLNDRVYRQRLCQLPTIERLLEEAIDPAHGPASAITFMKVLRPHLSRINVKVLNTALEALAWPERLRTLDRQLSNIESEYERTSIVYQLRQSIVKSTSITPANLSSLYKILDKHTPLTESPPEFLNELYLDTGTIIEGLKKSDWAKQLEALDRELGEIPFPSLTLVAVKQLRRLLAETILSPSRRVAISAVLEKYQLATEPFVRKLDNNSEDGDFTLSVSVDEFSPSTKNSAHLPTWFHNMMNNTTISANTLPNPHLLPAQTIPEPQKPKSFNIKAFGKSILGSPFSHWSGVPKPLANTCLLQAYQNLMFIRNGSTTLSEQQWGNFQRDQLQNAIANLRNGAIPTNQITIATNNPISGYTRAKLRQLQHWLENRGQHTFNKQEYRVINKFIEDAINRGAEWEDLQRWRQQNPQREPGHQDNSPVMVSELPSREIARGGFMAELLDMPRRNTQMIVIDRTAERDALLRGTTAEDVASSGLGHFFLLSWDNDGHCYRIEGSREKGASSQTPISTALSEYLMSGGIDFYLYNAPRDPLVRYENLPNKIKHPVHSVQKLVQEKTGQHIDFFQIVEAIRAHIGEPPGDFVADNDFFASTFLTPAIIAGALSRLSMANALPINSTSVDLTVLKPYENADDIEAKLQQAIQQMPDDSSALMITGIPEYPYFAYVKPDKRNRDQWVICTTEEIQIDNNGSIINDVEMSSHQFFTKFARRIDDIATRRTRIEAAVTNGYIDQEESEQRINNLSDFSRIEIIAIKLNRPLQQDQQQESETLSQDSRYKNIPLRQWNIPTTIDIPKEPSLPLSDRFPDHDSEGKTFHYSHQYIVQIECDNTSYQAAKRLFKKHPHESTWVQWNVEEGTYRIVAGPPRPLDAHMRVNLVGHSYSDDGAKASSRVTATMIAGQQPTLLAKKLHGFFKDLSDYTATKQAHTSSAGFQPISSRQPDHHLIRKIPVPHPVASDDTKLPAFSVPKKVGLVICNAGPAMRGSNKDALGKTFAQALHNNEKIDTVVSATGIKIKVTEAGRKVSEDGTPKSARKHKTDYAFNNDQMVIAASSMHDSTHPITSNEITPHPAYDAFILPLLSDVAKTIVQPSHIMKADEKKLSLDVTQQPQISGKHLAYLIESLVFSRSAEQPQQIVTTTNRIGIETRQAIPSMIGSNGKLDTQGLEALTKTLGQQNHSGEAFLANLPVAPYCARVSRIKNPATGNSEWHVHANFGALSELVIDNNPWHAHQEKSTVLLETFLGALIEYQNRQRDHIRNLHRDDLPKCKTALNAIRLPAIDVITIGPVQKLSMKKRRIK